MARYGVGNECYFLNPSTSLEGVETVTSNALIAMSLFDRAGLQLVVDPDTETFDAEGDSVDDATDVWTIAGIDFTGTTGGTLTVTGSEDNDGTFTITAGSDGSVTTAGATTVDETFGPGVEITLTFPLLEGAWTIEISNDFTPDSSAGDFGQLPNSAGHWTDITSAFSPAIADVETVTAATANQYCQADICVRAIRFTFTSTDGFGFPRVLGQLRSMS